MVINDNLYKELISLQKDIEQVIKNNSVTDEQIELFLRNLERRRYAILNQIKIYNDMQEIENKIEYLDNDYKASCIDNVIKLDIPEMMPSYKNLKTHTYKRILLNIARVSREYKDKFKDEIFVYIKLFDNIKNWDVDNKFIKCIPDGLILSEVIKDDNIGKMFYCVRGEFSENPHTEVYISDAKNTIKFLEKYKI